MWRSPECKARLALRVSRYGGLAADVVDFDDLISSEAARISIMHSEELEDRTAATCVFETDFLDPWIESGDC